MNQQVGFNDGLRLLLELAALAGWGMLGHSLARGSVRWALAAVLPLAVATAWGVLRVPNDPGPALVAVAGWVRMGLEALVFVGATIGIGRHFGSGPALAFLAVTLGHYAVAWRRVVWLLGGGR